VVNGIAITHQLALTCSTRFMQSIDSEQQLADLTDYGILLRFFVFYVFSFLYFFQFMAQCGRLIRLIISAFECIINIPHHIVSRTIQAP